MIEDILDELIDLPRRRAEIDMREVALIDAALDAGETLSSLALLYGFTSQAMGKRYRKIGGTRALRPGRVPEPRNPGTKAGVSIGSATTEKI